MEVHPTDGDLLFAGGPGSGLRRSHDRGRTWERLPLPEPDLFSVAASPADGVVYAGTEPSRLFRSDDRGESWGELEALQQIPSRESWSFPPRPWTSHVSAIAPHPHDGDLLLVGIELGGLMRSEDGGATWEDHRPGAQRDVHHLAWHPGDGDRAYEAGGGGAAWSRDRGRHWEPADRGRDRDYVWGLAVDASDPDLWYVSASPSASRAHRSEDASAVVYRWRDDGPWEAVGRGLPSPSRSMIYALAATGEHLYAGSADNSLWTSADQGEQWTSVHVRGGPRSGFRTIRG